MTKSIAPTEFQSRETTPTTQRCQGVFADWMDSSADRKSTRLNSSHLVISYAVFCLKKKAGAYLAGLGHTVVAHLTAAVHHSNLEGRWRGFARSFFFNDTATTEIYTLSLHDALPI